MNFDLQNPGSTSFTAVEISLSILIAAGLGVIIACLHLLATRDKERDDLWRPLILIAPLIAIATVAVGTNIAAAFTLFGTLAIVRFRTRIRKPLDAVFVIFSVVIGLASGNENFLVAVIGTVIVGGAIFILSLRLRTTPEYLGRMRLVLRPHSSSDEVWKQILERRKLTTRILSSEYNAGGDTRTVVLETRASSAEAGHEALEELSGVEQITRSSFKPIDS